MFEDLIWLKGSGSILTRVPIKVLPNECELFGQKTCEIFALAQKIVFPTLSFSWCCVLQLKTSLRGNKYIGLELLYVGR